MNCDEHKTNYLSLSKWRLLKSIYICVLFSNYIEFYYMSFRPQNGGKDCTGSDKKVETCDDSRVSKLTKGCFRQYLKVLNYPFLDYLWRPTLSVILQPKLLFLFSSVTNTFVGFQYFIKRIF